MVRLNGVFEGGGIKGIALVGALEVLEEHGVVFEAVAGTSAGSLVAALYSVGYAAREMKEILLEKNFESLLDRHAIALFGLWQRYGLHKGDKLHEWVYELLKKKGYVTFGDLKGPDLTIIASNLTDRDFIFFNKGNAAIVDVATAVRMSSGIPLFFDAYRWGEKLVVDGGLLSNYPLWVFRDSTVPTIGLKLVPASENKPPKAPNSFLGFLASMAGTMSDAHDRKDEKNSYFASTIHIDTGTIPSTKFMLSQEDKVFLHQSGRSAALQFLSGPGRRFLVSSVPPSEASRLAEAERTLDEIFTRLPEVADVSTIGAPPPPLDAGVQEAFESAEQTLVEADHLKTAKDATKLAVYFSRLGSFRVVVRDYPRAIAHYERAVELNPIWADGHQRLGAALTYQAAGGEPGAKETLLSKAERALTKARELNGRDTVPLLHDLAWLSDERADYSAAAKFYRAALVLSDKEEAEEWEPVIRYNLACALAKAGDGDGALAELALVPSDVRIWAETDPELEMLGQSRTLGPRFRELLREAQGAPPR